MKNIDKFRNLGCNMSINIHFLHDQLDYFPDNVCDVSEEQKVRFLLFILPEFLEEILLLERQQM